MKVSTPLVLAVAVAAGLLGLGAQLWLSRGGTPSASSSNRPASAAAAGSVGTAAPNLSLPALDGRTIRLPADFAGRPLLINFWASWCAPCLEEMPELERYSREQGRNGVQVIGVALDAPDAVRDFLTHTPVGYPILLDQPGADDASVRLGNVRGALPYSVLIDRQGRIAKTRLGPFEPGEISGWVGDP